MSRFPPIPPKDLTPEQKATADMATVITTSSFGDIFTYKRSDGAFIGPFAPWLHTPSVLGATFELLRHLAEIPGLPPSAREVAILVTGSHYRTAYEVYAHERFAVSKGFLSISQIKQIKAGEKPEGLNQGEDVAYDVATEFVKKRGPLNDEAWKRAVRCFGRDGTLGLIHFVGFYCYMSIYMNGCDVPLPDGEEPY